MYPYRNRFRRRLNQSKTIRAAPVSHPDAKRLSVGDYVHMRGTVSAGVRTLESPMKRVPCVSYRVRVVRVVDSRTAKKKVTFGTTFARPQGRGRDGGGGRE